MFAKRVWSGREQIIQAGNAVVTHSLLTESLNGKLGVVIEFNEAKQRFAVQLVGCDGQPKLLRGSNLRVVKGLDEAAARQNLVCHEEVEVDSESDVGTVFSAPLEPSCPESTEPWAP
eukprot:9797021-Karenia_brevis.AAC.1